MKKPLLSALIFTLLFIAALACQPSPKEDVIVNKGSESYISATFVPYEAPAHYKTEPVEKNSCTYIVDADVIVPQVKGFPVKIMERFVLDDETLLKWTKLFVGDTPLIVPGETTKQDIQKQIESFTEELGKAMEGNDNYHIEFVNAIIEGLKEEYARAPESSAAKPFSPVDFADGEMVWCSTGTTTAFVFNFEKNGQEFYYWRDDSSIYPLSLYPADEQLVEEQDRKWKRYLDEEFDISQEQALITVENTLKAMGLTDFAVERSEKTCFIRNEALASKGWIAYCTRSSGGMLTCLQLGVSISDRIMPVIGAPWELERIIIGVDAGGVVYLWALGLSAESGTLLENTALVSFDKLTERVRDLLLLIYAPHSEIDGGYTQAAVRVTKIELRIANISKMDDMEHGLLIPIWHISYETDLISAYGHNVIKDNMSIDARDGSYIEPQLLTTGLATYGG
jgi:hypothetical protein